MGVGVCQTRQRSSSQNCPSLALVETEPRAPVSFLLGIFSNIDMVPNQPEGQRLVILWTSSSSHDACCHCFHIPTDTIHAGLSWGLPEPVSSATSPATRRSESPGFNLGGPHLFASVKDMDAKRSTQSLKSGGEAAKTGIDAAAHLFRGSVSWGREGGQNGDFVLSPALGQPSETLTRNMYVLRDRRVAWTEARRHWHCMFPLHGLIYLDPLYLSKLRRHSAPIPLSKMLKYKSRGASG